MGLNILFIIITKQPKILFLSINNFNNEIFVNRTYFYIKYNVIILNLSSILNFTIKDLYIYFVLLKSDLKNVNCLSKFVISYKSWYFKR